MLFRSLFCQVGSRKEVEAWLIVDQGDVQWLEKGQNVQFLCYSDALKPLEGKIRDIPNVDVEELPPELSNLAGGEVATKTDPRTGQEKPIHTYYYVVVPLEDTYGFLQPGLRGMAKIEAKKMPLGPRLWRLFKRTFHFEV